MTTKTVTPKTPMKKSETPARKGTPTTATSTTLKNQFNAKKIGVNMIVTFNKENYARRVSKEEADTLKKKMALYNKRPSDTAKKAIVKLLTPVTTKKIEDREKMEAQIKGYKKLQAKQEKTTKKTGTIKKDVLSELEDMLNENKENITKVENILAKFKTIEVPQSVEASTRRGGEY